MSSWVVPVYAQSTENKCWEACARMMWHWRHESLDGYVAAAGAYATLDRGLDELEMTTFYTQLGIRYLPHPRGANLRHALGWTPVIFTSINQMSGHAMVLSGYADSEYTVVNPCGVQSIDFESNANTCSSTTIQRTGLEVEDPLGTRMWYW